MVSNVRNIPDIKWNSPKGIRGTYNNRLYRSENTYTQYLSFMWHYKNTSNRKIYIIFHRLNHVTSRQNRSFPYDKG